MPGLRILTDFEHIAQNCNLAPLRHGTNRIHRGTHGFWIGVVGIVDKAQSADLRYLHAVAAGHKRVESCLDGRVVEIIISADPNGYQTIIHLPVFGVISLILSAWTTNVSNAYSAGLNFVMAFNAPDNRRREVTVAAGIVGIILGLCGILTRAAI